MSHKTTRQLIAEITLRSVAETLPGTQPKDIETVSDPLIDLIESVVAGVKPNANISCDSYRTFCIWNEILDKIEREIPLIAGKMEVTGSAITRTQRKVFHATSTADSDRQIKAERMDA